MEIKLDYKPVETLPPPKTIDDNDIVTTIKTNPYFTGGWKP